MTYLVDVDLVSVPSAITSMVQRQLNLLPRLRHFLTGSKSSPFPSPPPSPSLSPASSISSYSSASSVSPGSSPSSSFSLLVPLPLSHYQSSNNSGNINNNINSSSKNSLSSSVTSRRPPTLFDMRSMSHWWFIYCVLLFIKVESASFTLERNLTDSTASNKKIEKRENEHIQNGYWYE